MRPWVLLVALLPIAVEASESVDHHRNRLLETYAQHRGAFSRCEFWNGMTGVERGVFLTHTDMLGHRSCFENDSVPTWQKNQAVCKENQPCSCPVGAEQALDHVFRLWAVNGTDPGCCSGTNCCNGGVEWHRTFWSADDALVGHFRNFDEGLPEWGKSGDWAGAHAPFNLETETVKGTPRGQIQLWRYDNQATVLSRNGVVGIFDPHIFEMDQDYNWIHDSNPEGFYSSTYGRAVYKRNWNWTQQLETNRGDGQPTTFAGNGWPRAVSELVGDAVWLPTCGAHFINLGGVVNPWTYRVDDIHVGQPLSLYGHFAENGNRVFVYTRRGTARLEGAAGVLYESPLQINVQLPITLGPGEALVLVEDGGVLTNGVWINVLP